MPTRLGSDVWWLDLRGVNAYLADDEGAVTLIDAGPPWEPGGALQGLIDAGFALSALDRVLVTHYDVDHVGDLSRLAGLDVTVYAGAGDAPLLTGDAKPDWRSRKGAFQRAMAPLVGGPIDDVQPVTDGDTVGSFTVYETPGHTPGHVSYVSDALDAAFLGDLVRESTGRFEPSPWALSADTAAVDRSIRALADRAPSVEIAGPGHGVPFQTGGKARLDDLAVWLS